MKNLTNKPLLTIIFLLSFSLINAQELGLNKYKSFIQNNFPQFIKHFGLKNFNNFKEVKRVKINLEKESMDIENYTVEEWKKHIELYKPFLDYNPQKDYYIDLYSSRVGLRKEAGKYYGSYDVDSELKLGIVKGRKTYKLSSAGPSGGFSEAKWVNNETAIIVSYFDLGQRDFSPEIYILNLKLKTLTYYSNEIDLADSWFMNKKSKPKIYEDLREDN